MTKIIYIRHGQTEWNVAGKYQGQTDVALTPLGVEQAAALAKFFPVPHIDAIYSSDLSRAMRTAEAVAKRFGLTVQPRRELRELHFGEWEGCSLAAMNEGWPELYRDFFRHPDRLAIPGGETFPHLQQRATACIAELCRAHEGQTIAVVAHGAILRTLLCAALHIDLRYVWTIRQFNTAVSIVRYESGGEGWPTVELLNSTAHLDRAGVKK
ncbi:histidine phosphatase family protein [Selenomonas sp.]|uniref:histidine phosphatase family protein n=1 Tax=Selenomonas sp. TaxID=2053611 RepID=UPI0025F543EB|nr:histidine phosphatase family protein [Selenomonas sp.]MCI6284082.1 histidine phosphatase family protein [Selenomonas sp.]